MTRIQRPGYGGQLATGLVEVLPVRGFESLLVGQLEFEFDDPATVIATFDVTAQCAVACAPPGRRGCGDNHEPAAP